MMMTKATSTEVPKREAMTMAPIAPGPSDPAGTENKMV